MEHNYPTPEQIDSFNDEMRIRTEQAKAKGMGLVEPPSTNFPLNTDATQCRLAMAQFEQEVEKLINRNSIENYCGTPDFVIALYLRGCLESYIATAQANAKWHKG